MYYKRDNVLYMSSYDSQCHVGKCMVIFSLTEAKLQQSAFNSDLWFAEVVNGRRFFTFYTMTVAKAQQHI